mgnify:FL=1
MNPLTTSSAPKNGIRAMDNKKHGKKHTSRKLRKIRRKLNKLYPEYKQLNITKTDNEKLNQLIDNISKIEYKYIQYLKIQ